MSQPWPCPICSGAGTVDEPPPPDFPGTYIGPSGRHPCRACNGKGIVWEPQRMSG